jgi:ACS family tartrate transporter-like MFS transporter
MSLALSNASVGKQTRGKIARRILPFVFVLYIISYLDRANVAFAKLPMSADLGFSEAVFGFGAGIFFLGYLLLEIPGALIVEHWSARKWIARILVSWGVCTVVIGFVRTPFQFYAARFLLGIAEAGFFPGIIVYLTHWFAKQDRAGAMSGFILAVPISLALGAPLSAFILQFDWFGLAGWRWMFILEGLPAIVFGAITFFYLTDHPRDAHWLEASERDWISEQLEIERDLKRKSARFTILAALGNRNVLLLGSALFFVVVGGYGFLFWLPTTIKRTSGMSNIDSTLWSALPFAAGLVTILFSGWSSDRTKERRFHTSIPMILTGVFFALSALPNQSFPAVMLWLCLTGATAYAWAPSFWALPTLLLGESAAAASVGFINAIGNFGGFMGPSIVGYLLAKNYSQWVVSALISTSFLVAGILILFIRKRYIT